VVRKLLLTILYITTPIVVGLGVYQALESFFFSALSPADTSAKIFEVAPQSTFKGIAKELERQGFIRSHWSIVAFAKIRGQDTSIKAGEYELSPSMMPSDILEKMASGKMFLRKITLKEGESMWEIGPDLEQQNILPRIEFEKLLSDPSLVHELGIEGPSLEGYLFPETYQFPRNTPAKKIVAAMYEQLQKRWLPEWDERLKELSMTKHQVLTLASIVEKESGSADEQPIISSVFYNRLKKGMKLQADPTVIYGIQNFNGNITKEDLQTPTPYNTYVITGLPPGPIANPGLSAIKATLYPATTDYLYFVANGQGGHIFSETLDAHNDSVNTYQRNSAP
jgi:UPF0755 protein